MTIKKFGTDYLNIHRGIQPQTRNDATIFLFSKQNAAQQIIQSHSKRHNIYEWNQNSQRVLFQCFMNFAGIASEALMCKNRSGSLVQGDFFFRTAFTMAHELGHRYLQNLIHLNVS